jgi:hypothetical protein
MEIHHQDPFTVAFDYASGVTGERFQNPLWQITEIFTGGRFRDSVKRVKLFGSELVEKAVLARWEKTPARMSNPERSFSKTFDSISGTLINSLLDTIDDQQMVADAALNYLTAGM